MDGLCCVLRVSSLLHRSDLTFRDTDVVHTFFIDNQQTVGHRSVIFGLRELNATETAGACLPSALPKPPITDQPATFSSNYALRVYTSGCYYLDGNNEWQSNGLTVT